MTSPATSRPAAREVAETPIRVAIADGCLLLRQTLRQLLSAQPDLEIAGDGEDAMAALELIRQQRPDVLLLRSSISGKDGLDLTRDVRNLAPHTRVLVLGPLTAPHRALRYLRAGASGFLPESAQGQAVVEAIRAVHSGSSVVPPALRLGDLQGCRGSEATGPPEEQLSDREFQVLCRLAAGSNNREVAGVLHISVKTVDTHRANLLRKLGLRNNSDLTRFAVRRGLVRA
jgi:DNA-binding NarL/FixJ family response regulator